MAPIVGGRQKGALNPQMTSPLASTPACFGKIHASLLNPQLTPTPLKPPAPRSPAKFGHEPKPIQRRSGRISSPGLHPLQARTVDLSPSCEPGRKHGGFGIGWLLDLATWVGIGLLAAVMPVLGLSGSAKASVNTNAGPDRAYVQEKHVAEGLPGHKSTVARNPSISNVLTYKVQEILSQRLAGKLLAVLLVALPVIGVGGALYKAASGLSWRKSISKAYNAMSDVPGADICGEESLQSSIVVNLIFFSGVLTFAVILGIVCDDISSMVEEVRAGNYQIIEEGHTIILNCNHQLGSVLRQMAIARQERGPGTFRGPVIVMSSESKDELDQIVEQSLHGLRLDVRTRTGITHGIMDLKKIAADKASRIIWLEPASDDETFVSARRAAAIASLKTLGAGTTATAHVVVQTPECTDNLPTGLPAVSLAVRSPPSTEHSKLDIVEMYDAQNLERLLAQCSLQPGLGKVMTQIFQQSSDSCEIYIEAFKQLTGKPYCEARKMFDVAVPCGVLQHKNTKLWLNPSENYVLQDDDKMVLLAQSLESVKLIKTAPPEISDWVRSVEHLEPVKEQKKVLVLSFGTDCAGFLEAMGEFADENVEVNVVTKSKPEILTEKGPSRLNIEVGNPASFRRLAKTDLSTVSSIVLAGLEGLDDQIADAQVISSLMQIQDLANEQNLESSIHVVAPITSPKNQEVANHLISEGQRIGMKCSTDLILPSDLSSGVLTQVAAYPKLELVFKDLLDSEGAEIFIRDPATYSLQGRGPVCWRDVTEILRASGQTAIGYIGGDESVHIGPVSTDTHVYEEGDKLVVISQK